MFEKAILFIVCYPKLVSNSEKVLTNKLYKNKNYENRQKLFTQNV
jgi:hypothetical protein